MKNRVYVLIFTFFVLLLSCEAKADNFEFKLRNNNDDKKCVLSFDGNKINIEYSEFPFSEVKRLEYTISTINSSWITEHLNILNFIDSSGDEVANIHNDFLSFGADLKFIITFKDKNGDEYYVESNYSNNEFTKTHLRLLDYIKRKAGNLGTQNKEVAKIKDLDVSGANQASSSINVISTSAEELVTMAFATFPVADGIPSSNKMYDELKSLGLNPTLKDNGEVCVCITETPEKCKGFNAVKALFKLDGCDILPQFADMGYLPPKYNDGMYSYSFSWPYGNFCKLSREECEKQSSEFARFILQSLKEAGFSMKGTYKDAECLTPNGQIHLITNDSYNQWSVLLYFWINL